MKISFILFFLLFSSGFTVWKRKNSHHFQTNHPFAALLLRSLFHYLLSFCLPEPVLVLLIKIDFQFLFAENTSNQGLIIHSDNDDTHSKRTKRSYWQNQIESVRNEIQWKVRDEW